jgi:hypothetical protein
MKRDHLEDQNVDGRIIEWILKKEYFGFGMESPGSGQEVAGCC